MTDSELAIRAADNLEATYLAIGSAAPEAFVQRREGYTLCLGRLDHPVGNFAVVRRMAALVPSELAASARDRTSFHAYVPDTESRPQTGRAFAEAGFRRSYGLVQMVCEPTAHAFECGLLEAITERDRLRVATFMTHQFFSRQRSSIREHISWSTVHSGLNLYEICSVGQSIGAVMVSRSAGMLGIYNLCIDGSKRHRGYGSDAVFRLLNDADEQGIPAVLQADRSLAQWYSRLGFREIGTVDVFGPGR